MGRIPLALEDHDLPALDAREPFDDQPAHSGQTLVRGELAPSLPSRGAAEEFARASRADGLDLAQAIGLLRRSW